MATVKTKRVGGKWVVAYQPVVMLCLGPPLEIAPGASYVYRDDVVAGTPGSTAQPQFQVTPLSGTYRAVWGVHGARPDGGGPGQLLPAASRTSNEFQLQE